MARKKTSRRKARVLTLTTEEGGDQERVSEVIATILEGDAFGKFAVLAATDGTFVQAASAWDPSSKTKQFMKRHGSDPWVLERREGDGLFRASEQLTLSQVREAFLAFARETPHWHDAYTWAAPPD